MITTTICTLFFCTAFPQEQSSQETMSAAYRVRAKAVHAADPKVPIEVDLRIEHPPQGPFVVQMPVWTPGSYRLRDFPDRVYDVQARSTSGKALQVFRLNRHSWEIENTGTSTDTTAVTISYRVEIPAKSRGQVRGTQRRTITYEGPGVYMFVRDHLDIPCRVDFDLPKDWQIGTGLKKTGRRSYFAQDYDFLADCPVKLGRFQTYAFESHGKPIDVVVDGPGDIEFDSEAWIANLKRVVDTQGNIFGGFPFERYTFLYSAHPGRRGFDGGLEHLTSTMIGLAAGSLRQSPRTGVGITAHEFIHLWNVKRMRPIELGPFDYTRPNRTTSLWIAEGFTSYYTPVTLARCGLSDEKGFWSSMRRAISSVENNPGREHTSCTMNSYQVWDKQARDRSVSYYTSGQVIALLLDIEIRASTKNEKSLDDFMRQLFRACEDQGRGYTEQEVINLLSALCGRDFTAWFDRYVRGTAVPPYAKILSKAGIQFTETRSRIKQIRGLRARGRSGLTYANPDATGLALLSGGKVKTTNGQEIGDRKALATFLEPLKPGTSVSLVIDSYSGRETAIKVKVTTVPRVKVKLEIAEKASAAARAIRGGIIGR